MELTQEIRNNIRGRRKAMGMTCEECAKKATSIASSDNVKCSLSAATLNSIETRPEYKNPKDKTMYYLCKALDCSVDFIVGDYEYPNDEVEKAMCGFTDQEWINQCDKYLNESQDEVECVKMLHTIFSFLGIEASVFDDANHTIHFRDGTYKGLDVGTLKALRIVNDDGMEYCVPARNIDRLRRDIVKSVYSAIRDWGYKKNTTLYQQCIGGAEHWEDLKRRIEEYNSESEES